MTEERSYTFSDSEVSALLIGLGYALESVESCIDAYTKSGDNDIVNEERKLLKTIKSLLKRFIPNLTEKELECEWEGSEG